MIDQGFFPTRYFLCHFMNRNEVHASRLSPSQRLLLVSGWSEISQSERFVSIIRLHQVLRPKFANRHSLKWVFAVALVTNFLKSISISFSGQYPVLSANMHELIHRFRIDFSMSFGSLLGHALSFIYSSSLSEIDNEQWRIFSHM